MSVYEAVITGILLFGGLYGAWTLPRIWRNELGWVPGRPPSPPRRRAFPSVDPCAVTATQNSGSPWIPTVRTLAHHMVHAHAVTLEQWWLLDASRGWALSPSWATLDYDRVADSFEQLVSGFRPAVA